MMYVVCIIIGFCVGYYLYETINAAINKDVEKEDNK